MNEFTFFQYENQMIQIRFLDLKKRKLEGKSTLLNDQKVNHNEKNECVGSGFFFFLADLLDPAGFNKWHARGHWDHNPQMACWLNEKERSGVKEGVRSVQNKSKGDRVLSFLGSVTPHFKAHRLGLRTKTSGIKGWRRKLSVLVITIQQKD